MKKPSKHIHMANNLHLSQRNRVIATINNPECLITGWTSWHRSNRLARVEVKKMFREWMTE